MFYYKVVPTSVIILSESPTKGEYNWAPLSERNMALHDVAAACTNVVLQHPGGPYSNNPLGHGKPIRLKALGCFIGHSTTCKLNVYLSKTDANF